MVEKRTFRCMDSIARKAIKSVTMMLLALTCVLFISVDAKAETNNNVAFYLARQPANVQAYIARQGVNIQVVDQLQYSWPGLIAHAYTTMYGTEDYISGIDIVLLSGYESALTHEVGHCVSNLGNVRYYWAKTPEFMQIWAVERMGVNGADVLMAQGWEDPVEYFACAYDMYINFPQLLMKQHPQTYNYIQAVVAQTQ